MKILRRPEPRPISPAEEEALRCAARTEDTSRWTARLSMMLARRRQVDRTVLERGSTQHAIATGAVADALRPARLNPDDVPPVFEALVALLFDAVPQRGACRVAMKHVDSASPRITFEDSRGRTKDYPLSRTTCQLLGRLPYVSSEQPLLGLSLRSSSLAWRRICAMAALPYLSMCDVWQEATRRRAGELHPLESAYSLGSTAT